MQQINKEPNNTEYITLVAKMLEEVRHTKPMVHMIPNQVSQALCADVMAAVGARPIMAIAKEEVEEIVSQSQSLVINMGQLTGEKKESIQLAIERAIEEEKWVVVDPVGAGASQFRLTSAKAIEQLQWKGIMKVNTSEYHALREHKLTCTGVDGVTNLSKRGVGVEASLDKGGKERAICITGAVDFIWTGKEWLGVGHNSTQLPRIVGSGCALGALCGVFLTVAKVPYEAALAASMVSAVASQIAENDVKGYGDYKIKWLDALSTLTTKDLLDLGQDLLIKGDESNASRD